MEQPIHYSYSRIKINQEKFFNKFLTFIRAIPILLFPVGCIFEFGNGVSPTISGEVPIVSTSEVVSITLNTAICGGNVTTQGSSAIKARGVCWDTYGNPSAYSGFITVDGLGTGAFTSTVMGLTSNTTYYVRAYATNESGTAYGTNKSFKTPPLPKVYGEGVTDIENNYYPTVIIDSQEWMAKNLMTTMLNDGTSLKEVRDSLEWRDLSTPAYCWLLNNETEYKQKYGGLYNFHVVETEKLCPVGWHVPSLSEWNILFDYLGGKEHAIIKLKEKDPDIPIIEKILPNGWNGNNEVGFTALASGLRISNGIFDGGSENFSANALFWTSSESETDLNYKWTVFLNSSLIFNTFDGRYGSSVRCVKN